VSPTRDQTLHEIRRHRSALLARESQLTAPAPPQAPPIAFALAFSLVAGAAIGIVGSLASLAFHVAGSLAVHQHPLMLLRVYGTMFLGPWALTTEDPSFFLLVALVHVALGAIAGVVFHLLANRFVSGRSAAQVGLGLLYGLFLWIVNFYVVIPWLQPPLVGDALVRALTPAWIAAVTHVVYGLTVGVLQPLARLIPAPRR
jgi:hypothetical protein